MQAAIFSGPKQLDVVDFNLPAPADDELIIRVGACGICGTDFHIFHGEAPAAAPVIPGHEYAGEVIETGADVSGFKPGDRVAVNPNIHCGYCDYCRQGRINLCFNLRALGVTINGGFAQYSIVPQSQAYLLPGSFPAEQAAFAEPLSCCIHGIDQADIQLSDTVAIIGAGTIGLLMLQLAKLKGASRVVVFEPVKAKREKASALNADYIFDPYDDDFERDVLSRYPKGFNKVIECAGTESAAELSLKLATKGGCIVLFGLASLSASLKLPLQFFFHKELTVKSSLLNPYTFQTAVDLLVTNKINTTVISPSVIPLNAHSLHLIFEGDRNDFVTKYMVIPNS